MQEYEISKIEKIIRERILEEKDLVFRDLVESTNNATDKAVERINGVYNSIMNTLKKLDLKDSTFIDIFERTKGNVRVYDNVVVGNYNREVETRVGGNTLGYRITNPGIREVPPIQLQENKRYKIVIMALEEGELKPER